MGFYLYLIVSVVIARSPPKAGSRMTFKVRQLLTMTIEFEIASPDEIGARNYN